MKGINKVTSKIKHYRQALKRSSFSKTQLSLFVVAFAAIGGYIIYSSFASTTIPRPDHVVVVMEENHSYSEVIGSGQAPYIDSLANQGALFTNSFAIQHPSQPNYLDIFSGSDQGITNDNCPQSSSAPNLGSELASAGLTFKAYSETLPSAGSMVCTASGAGNGSYARKHAPWTDFTNVNQSLHLPFSSFPTNYASLPAVSFVIPNLQDDMHTGTIPQADSWLQANMDGYAQWAKSHNSLLIVTWDEDDKSQSNQIPTIFVGQAVQVGKYSEKIDHFSVLRTIEDMYGLSHAGAAATATPIADVWTGSQPPPPPPPPPTDKTPPTVSITSPATGTPVSGTVTLKATASDNVGVAGVQYHFDSPTGGNLGTLIKTSPYTYNWDTTGVTNGQYTIMAAAFDAAGNEGDSTSITVTVSNAAAGGGGGGSGGNITLTDGSSWACSGPVNLNRVVITNPTGDGAFMRSGCTGTINYLEVTGTSHDGMHINAGAHDLVIKSGLIRCITPPGVGTPQHFHQDGIQVMGGLRITMQNMNDQCVTANNSAMFINEGAGGQEVPTDIVCDNCVFNSGTTATVKIYNSSNSGVKNSTVYEGSNTWIQTVGAVSPIDQNNQKLACPQPRTVDCGGSPPPPPPPTNLPADINGDGKVDAADLSILITHFNQSGGHAQGDINGDNRVDISDLSILLREFGS